MSTIAWLLIMIAVFLIRAVFKGKVLDADGKFILPEYTTNILTALITNDTARLKQLDADEPGAGISLPASSIVVAPSSGGQSTGSPGVSTPSEWDKMNPRTVEQAITWASQRQTFPVGMCERMVTLAYGRPGGQPTANAHWRAATEKHTDGSVPPRGALVYWKTKNAAGHVALSAGGGQVFSTDFNGRTFASGMMTNGPIEMIDKWGPRLGWTPPKDW